MTFKYNLDIPEFMEAKEAAERWGISDSRIRQKINDFPEGQKRKFGKQWVVTEEGMRKLFGKPKNEEAKLMVEMKTEVLKVLEGIKGKMSEVIVEDSQTRKVRYLNDLYIEDKKGESIVLNSHTQSGENKGKSMRTKIELNKILDVEYGLGCFWMDFDNDKRITISIYDTDIEDLRVFTTTQI